MSRPFRVLHVDDEPGFAELAATVLEREHERFTVETATSAEEALDVLDGAEVDCVISDYDMPGRNGIEFLETVRSTDPDLPFILFTGKGSEEIASEAISAGVTDYLQKEGGTDQYAILANRVQNAVERNRFERQADRTLTQLEAISEHSADAIVIIDADSTITFANPRVEDYFGYTPTELEGESLTRIMPERHRQDHLTGIKRYLRTDERSVSWSNVEFHGLHRDGSEVPLSVSYGEFEQEGQRRFIGIMRELSDRKALESELRDREERFRQLAEHIREVVWMVDPRSDELLYVNPAFERIWGRPLESLYDDWRLFLEAVHPDDFDRVEAALTDLESGDYDEEYRIRRPNGEQRWIRDRAMPVENDAGEVHRVVGIASDVTEQREREQQLREQQSRLRAYQLTVENSVDLLAACDPEYNVLFANDQYQRYHGLEDVDDIQECRLPDLLGEAWDRTVHEWVDRALAGETVEYEMERQGPDGEARTLDIRYYPLREPDGTIVGVVAAIRDLSWVHESRQERERIIERVTDAIVEVDQHWRFSLVNDQAEELYGMRETDLLGKDFWEVFDTAEGTRFEEEYRTVMERREPRSLVEYFPQLDGWFDVKAYPKDDGGIAFYFVDVTEQRERERRLTAQQRFIDATLDALQDVFFVLDEAGTLLRWNERLVEVTGIASGDLGDLDPITVFVEEDRGRVEEAIERVIECGSSTIQAEVRTASGDRIPYELRCTRLDHPEADGHAVAGIARDISERRRRERSLARQKALLSAQQESVLDGMLVVDETREIVSYNSHFLELWGVPEDVVASGEDREVLQYVSDQLADSEAFFDQVEHLYDHPSETSREEIELEDGRVFDRYTTPLLGEDGTYFGRLWTFRDITERIDRQAELERQNDRLEQFASIVSHDLRNPLNVAEGRLELAEEDCPSEHHAAVEQAHDRMEVLIDDLLTLARQGETVTNLRSVSVADVAESAWNHVDTRQATLEVATTREIQADRSRLQQLFENLFRNAVEHGGEAVTVTVGDQPDGIYVGDDGVGLSDVDRDRLFDPGHSTSASGTGFGLSIVEQVAEAHGWSVRAEDDPSGGVRFVLSDIDLDHS